MKNVYMFPGQGSQFKGMGLDLFKKYPLIIEQANSQLGYSLEKLCLEDIDNKLTFTEFAQPALYTVNYLYYLDCVEQEGKFPDLVLGHSLGELVALLIAGAYDFSTGLKIVKYRANLMAKSAKGAMLAVIGCSKDDLSIILDEPPFKDIDIANINTKSQMILSGPMECIPAIKDRLSSNKNITCIPLAVSGAFHSRMMKSAADQFFEYISQFNFSDLLIPVVSNYSASYYQPELVKEFLNKQICSPVKWLDSINFLLNSFNEIEFKELGPGNILKNLVLQIKKDR